MIKKLILTTLIIAPTATLISCNSTSYEKAYDLDVDLNGVDDKLQANFELTPELIEYKKSQFDNFFDDIKQTSQSAEPTIYLNRDAGQVWNTTLQHAIATINYSNKIKNNNTKILYVGDYKVLKDNKRFNLNYLENKYKNSIVKDSYDSLKGEGKFSYIYESQSTRVSSYKSYFAYPEYDFLEYLLEPFIKQNPKQLFNFYIPDISFTALSSSARSLLLKHAKKIIILSDGNAQLDRFIPEYISYVIDKKDKPASIEELEKAFDKKENIDKYDFHDFLRLKDKIKIFNYQGSYSLYLNKIFDNMNKSWARINVYSYPSNLNKLNNEEWLKDTDYLKDILIANQLKDESDSDQPKTIEELMIINREKYDPKKKNMIFIGSSLFRTGILKTNNNLRENINSYFNKIQKLFPATEYNYIFKLHPYYTPETSLEYINTLFGKSDITDFIVLNPSVSWENMMSLDFQNFKTNPSKSVFFKTENNKIVPNIKLFTLQVTTTVLISTLQFLEQNIEGYDNLETKKNVVDPAIIPINENINIVNRDAGPFNYFETNLDRLYKIYKWILPSQDFFPIPEFKPLSEFIKN